MKRLLLMAGVLLLWTGPALSSTFLQEGPKTPTSSQLEWLTELPPDQSFIQIDDMRFEVSMLLRSGFTGTRWTDGMVYYVFDEGVTAGQRDNWREAAFQWTCAADLTFVEGEGDGNWSYVGMITGQQDMSIVSWNSIFIIAHEIGHALGQIHEQSRSDRDSFVEVHLDRVCQTCCSGGSCNHNFDIEAGSDNYGDYDFDSVMHYSQCAFDVCDDCWADPENCRTITVLEPWADEWQDRIGQRDHLSELDMAGMAVRYGATLNDPPVAQCLSYTAEADMDCCIEVSVADIDDGSHDPDGEGDVVSLCITAVDGTPVDCEQTVEVCGVGDHLVTLTITDECGETSSCDATVTVVDVTPPTMDITLNRDVLWPPNHKMVDILVTVTTEDNCDADPLVELVSVTSNEPEDGIGDGHTAPDIVIVDYLTLQLRSERMGGGDGRIYTLTYTATDFSGNQTEGSTEVRVPHDQSGTAMTFAGFLPGGAGIDPARRTFSLVVPTVAVDGVVTMDATRLDPGHVYVGNTEGCLRPVSSRLADVDRNGLPDLVVDYSTKAMARIPGSPLEAPGVPDAFVAGPGDHDAIGLHYRSGVIDYLVPDIMDLGRGMVLPVGADFASGDGAPPPPHGKTATALVSVDPNPFNPLTHIKFNVGSTSRITLSIYDYRGNLVRELRDEVMPPGPHEVVWDGRDRHGLQVAAGVYLSLLTDGKVRSTQKLVLLK